MRKPVSPEIWQQIQTAYASGIGLRELARNMGIPEGTVLARAKRKGWTCQIQSAKALAPRPEAAVTPAEAVALSLAEHSKRTRSGLARAMTRAAERAEQLDGETVIDRARKLKSVAETASLLHGGESAKSQTVVNLGVLLDLSADVMIQE